MGLRRMPVRGLDPADGTDGQVPVISGGKFVIGDAGGAGGFDRAGMPPRLVPYGVKLRGANIVPSDLAGGSTGDVWGQLFSDAAYFDSLIKPQVDALASVGGNAVRCIGGIGYVHNGDSTITDHVANYERFVDYSANQGLRVYACLSDWSHWAGATKDQALAIMDPLVEMLDAKPNVFAVDVVQEIGLGGSAFYGSNLHDFVAYLFADLRNHTSLPLTCSNLASSNNSSSQWSTSTTAALADVVDFYDFHPYYDGMVASDLAPFFTANATNKPLILGEYAADVTKPARYSAGAAVSAVTQVLGSFVWAITDFNASGAGGAWGPTGAWGLFDHAMVERPTLTTIFRTVPDHQGTLPEAGHIVIAPDGTVMPARARVKVTGYATVTDDPTNDQTVVDVTGDGTGGGGTSTYREVLIESGSSPAAALEASSGGDWLYGEVPA